MKRGFVVVVVGFIGAIIGWIFGSISFYAIGLQFDPAPIKGSSSAPLGGYASGLGFIGGLVGFLLGAVVFPLILTRLWPSKSESKNQSQHNAPPIPKP